MRFAVIGHPIGHTMSPFIHKRLFEISGVEAEYSVMDIAPENFPSEFKNIKDLKGCNLTIPHKSAVIPLLDELHPWAKLFGAVNTVKFGEKNIGYNTDCIGFTKALETENIPISGKVLLCGNGGAARMMAFVCAEKGCNLTFSVRESGIEKAEKIKEEIFAAFKDAEVSVSLSENVTGDFDLLLNATPCGMFPKIDAMPVSEKVLSKCQSVFDCIYNPNETKLLKKAKANGSKTAHGMPMLLWQAAAAQEIWNDVKFSEDDVNSLTEEAVREMERIFR